MSLSMTSELQIFRALADPTRFRIVGLLRRMELAVGELAQVLGQSQPRVSRHVRILCDAGLVERHKEGSWVFLCLGDPSRTEPLLEAIGAWTDAEAESAMRADIARLGAVQADRAAAAERYFAAQAENWDEIRSLHVAECEVEAAMREAIGDEPVGRLVDIGTGTGRMLELFAGRADGALGIDCSPEMLRLARVKLAEAELDSAELRQGDMYALPLPDGEADTVILHQVLHYAQQPGAAIAEAARLLTPEGRLLVADFAPHEHEELRDRHAHVRLGFSDEQMEGWFAAAGLALENRRQLEGGALTVRLWLGRRDGKRIRSIAA